MKNPYLQLLMFALGALAYKINLLKMLVLFIMGGILPGTTLVVPPSIMLIVSVTLLWLMFIRMTGPEVFGAATVVYPEPAVEPKTPRSR